LIASALGRFAAALAVVLLLAAAFAAAADPPAPEAEEAADFARRAAFGALHGPAKIFLESIDADAVLQKLLGPGVWAGLTTRQQELLRQAVRDHFLQALAPPAGTTGDVAWAAIGPSPAGAALVDLGLRYGASTVKTRWTVRHGPSGWTIEDITLVDPGLSLAAEMRRLLGPEPVRRLDVGKEARARALPRLLGVAAILAVVLLFAPRLPPERRRVLWVAAVPAILFLVDGALAVQRALLEPYALSDGTAPQTWRQYETRALAAQAEGRADTARDEWHKALEAGAPAGPVQFQMGLAARSRGATTEATADFERALAEAPPSPGAGRELGLLALSDGRSADARALLQRYVQETGPDPDALSALAVAQTNLGDTAAAAQTISSARALVGEDWRKAELEARIFARAGNAAATVAALRALEPQGRLDRAVLRAEPAYLPIATEPAWIGFLNEPSPPPR
jgi:Tfp pilus assembly protein PilF